MMNLREFAVLLKKQEEKIKIEYIETIKTWLAEFKITNDLLFLEIGSKTLLMKDDNVLLENKPLEAYDLRVISNVYNELRIKILNSLGRL